jgi:hypothetical protein
MTGGRYDVTDWLAAGSSVVFFVLITHGFDQVVCKFFGSN